MKYLVLVVLILEACTHSSNVALVREEYKSYIPARTAVLSCRSWDANNKIKNFPESNVNTSDVLEFCRQFDEFILESFKGQTFMRGFAPAAVRKFLSGANKSDLLTSFASYWSSDLASHFEDPVAYYEAKVRPSLEWRQWLMEFSSSVRHSDALLIPFLSYAREEHLNDRGLLLSKRVMRMDLLLVDMESGNIIWNSNRVDSHSKNKLPTSSDNSHPGYPEWNLLVSDLLVESMWKGYPGRIFL